MSNSPTDRQGHPPLDPKVADRLLELLSGDDKFRDTFASQPAQALQAAGLSAAQSAEALKAASCMNVTTKLASKEELQKSREHLLKYLTSAGTHTVVFVFNDGQVQTSMLKAGTISDF